MRKYRARRMTAWAGSSVRALRAWGEAAVAWTRGRDADRGASIVEYAGLLVIIALIVVAVRGLNLDTAISTAINTAVQKIIG